jgi:hypothetical protein
MNVFDEIGMQMNVDSFTRLSSRSILDMAIAVGETPS